MATLNDLRNLGYTVTEVQPTTPDEPARFSVSGFGFTPLVLYETDESAFTSIVAGHAVRAAEQTRGRNRDAIQAKLGVIRDVLRTNYTNWPSMTAAQKDAANRNAQRAIANLAALAADQLDDAGI